MAEFGLQKSTLKTSFVWSIIAVALILTMFLTACGKKGPLYLPENQAEKPVSTPTKPNDSQTK